MHIHQRVGGIHSCYSCVGTAIHDRSSCPGHATSEWIDQIGFDVEGRYTIIHRYCGARYRFNGGNAFPLQCIVIRDQ